MALLVWLTVLLVLAVDSIDGSVDCVKWLVWFVDYFIGFSLVVDQVKKGIFLT